MSDEIIANFENIPFLSAVKTAKEGDIIHEKFGDMTIVRIFIDEETYEERLEPDVLFRRRFSNGVLLRKSGSKAFVFVPSSELEKV